MGMSQKIANWFEIRWRKNNHHLALEGIQLRIKKDTWEVSKTRCLDGAFVDG